MPSIQLLSIDTQLFREGLKRLIAGSEFAFVGEAEGLAEAYRLVEPGNRSAIRPDIVITALDGREVAEQAEWLRRFRAALPEVRILALTDAARASALAPALRAEIDGHLLKDVSADVLVRSLRLVMDGQQVFPAGAMASLPGATVERSDKPSQLSLSAREQEIIRLLVNGRSNKQIAQGLSIPDATVKVHMKSLLRKMRASNRTQAAIWGFNNGYSDRDQPGDTSEPPEEIAFG